MKISDLLRQKLLWPCSVSHGYIVQNFHTTYFDFITCNSNICIQKWLVQNNNGLCYFLCERKCICAVIFLTSSQSHWATQAEKVELAVWFIHGDFCTVSRTNKPAARHTANKNIRLMQGLWGCTQWRSWLRHSATSLKVTGSIPDGVIGIFHSHNSSDRTMAVGLTQPLTEISTRNISGGVKAASAYGWQPYRLPWNLGASTPWNPQALSRPVMGLLYL
jgi:hypothetical protein